MEPGVCIRERRGKSGDRDTAIERQAGKMAMGNQQRREGGSYELRTAEDCQPPEATKGRKILP